jgi:formylglycine-generating enzyme required for sulfatase activity
METKPNPGCCMPTKSSITGKRVAVNQSSEKPESKRSPHYGSREGMVLIEAGSFLMGTDSDKGWEADGEKKVIEVSLDPYWISRCCVTNREFGEFVDDTGHVSEAEQFGWSYVFHILLQKSVLKRLKPQNVQGLEWWYGVEGAFWRKPEGPGSNIKKRMDYPAVHISWSDAVAYCQWKGHRLPTEAEWEKAARGGLEQKIYPWGDELHPEGKHRCNIWQGNFPLANTAEDGHVGPAPAKSFRANGFGMYNLVGNVWEWCSDWFSPNWRLIHKEPNPQGPDSGGSKVMKGGSYLCHDSYCNRYRVAARTSNTPDSSTGNLGFRTAMDV